MKNSVLVDYYEVNHIDKKEVLRYCGVKNRDSAGGQLDRRIDLLIEEAFSFSPFRAAWTVTDVKRSEKGTDAGFGPVISQTFQRGLAGCHGAVIAGATLGRDFDRHLEKYKKLSTSDSVIFQAAGTALIEEVMDMFSMERNVELQKDGKVLRPRFSPGYGDFDISSQEPILQLLDASGNLGIYLNDSFLMTPSKSVTALWGIRTIEHEEHIDGKIEGEKGCSTCSKGDCLFRVENGH